MVSKVQKTPNFGPIQYFAMDMRFRAEFFNIFNHPNFGSPNNSLTDPCSAIPQKHWQAA
jgi:hypothetical protein